MSTDLTLVFTGGTECLAGNQKIHKVSLPILDPTLKQLLTWMRSTLLKDCSRRNLLLMGNNGRPGVFVLVNDTECDQEKTVLRPDDTISFIPKFQDMSTALKLEFAGGSEFLVGNQTVHKVSIPIFDPTLRQVFSWMRSTLLKHCARRNLLLVGDSVRPEVFVLVNGIDWQLLDQEKTVLRPNDTISFLSTLHGMSTTLTIEFSGGSDFLVGVEKIHKVCVPICQPTLWHVLTWMRLTLLKDCTRTNFLLKGNNLRPGVLVRVNDTDWELLDKWKTILRPNDTISFISTHHGG